MLAVVRDVYGPPEVLRVAEVPRPTPGAGEVLVKVRASSLNRADKYASLGAPAMIRLATGLFRPDARHRGLGMDFVGDVEALGAEVTGLSVGDRVFGEHTLGQTWAQYACVPERLVARAPDGVGDAELACLPLAGLTALQGLRDFGRLQAGQSVLVHGATGAVGPLAVQMAKALGAGTVVAVCSGRNADLVRSLGADRVIPYDTEDFTALEQRFDVVFDVAGTRSLSELRRVLAPTGACVVVGSPEDGPLGPLGPMLAKMIQAPFVSQRVALVQTTQNRADLEVLAAMAADGRLRPPIDRQYPFEQVADALRYLATGHPPAKVVLTGWS
ncbi:MAG: NAD(P)-dependent alcohol dehydrogenase [Myxococcota bacterium]